MQPPKQGFLFLLIFFITATIAVAQPVGRKKTGLDEGWKFHLGHASDPSRDFNYGVATIFSKSRSGYRTAIDPAFNDSSWRSLDVPHDWVVELPFVNVPNHDVMAHGYKPVGGLFPETSIGWYRKHFAVAKSDSGARVEIQFDGIFRDANIWLNGFYVGNNKSGYIGASYDVTDYLRFDGDNTLVVRVDATQYEGWFYEGAGIYRHVWLNHYDPVHLTTGGVFVYAEMQGKEAVVHVESTVENRRLSAASCIVYTCVFDRNGKKIAQSAEQPISLSVGAKTTISQKMKIADPRVWSLEDPYLYRVLSIVKEGNRPLDQIRERFGIRTLRFDSKEGFFLNGKHVKILGANNHQDHAGTGSAIPDYLQYYRLNLLKDAGINAYRTSHNAPTPELLEASDSLGMLVLDETRLLNSSPEYISQLERLIKRDRNHPSVFMWSIGNEEGSIQTGSNGKRIAQSLLAKQKELDPTRTSTYGADLANVFQGVNEVIPVRGFNYRQLGAAAYHRDHPSQPIVGTEMGSTVSSRGVYAVDSVNGYVPDQDIHAPWWASRAEEWWPLAADNPYWMGGFIWTGFDYRGEPTPFRWPNINSHFGIMDMCGFPKNIYYYYQSWWTDKDVLHISPHWNWKDGGKPVDVWVNSNAERVELFLNGKSLGEKTMPRNSHLQWNVPYEAGVLEAVAFKRGRKLSTRVETTGSPYEVVVTPYRTTIVADGKDAVVINISVVDQQNREVPDANNSISFSVAGDARIIGVGNGDPSSHEPDYYATDSTWHRKLFNGKCQVILQAGKNTDKIRFEARSEGLRPGSTGIHTIHPGIARQVTPLRERVPLPPLENMIGADISFLPELEARGLKFSDKGIEGDAIEILRDHGFNCVRLRIFNNPTVEKGYSPGKGFCDLDHTLQMARRVKAAGMKLLLDFHYSDYWADPEKQFKPAAWNGLSFPVLVDSLETYTRKVIQALKNQGTPPDMVQVGNEINHGMVWPEGHIGNLNNLAELIQAGIRGVKSVDPSIRIMLHIALGGQRDECVFFLDNMLARNIRFDVIGISYYPKWHGTLDDLRDNLTTLARRYDQDIMVVEYSHVKREVHEIVFNLPGGKGKGTAIWEPLNTWESVFDRKGTSNKMIEIFDEMKLKFVAKSK